MKDKVKIKVNTTLDLIKYLITHNIEYTNLTKDNNTYILITKIDNYKKIKRRFDTKLLRYYGMNFIKQTYINNKFLIISFLISLLLLINLTNTINEVQINTNDQTLLESIQKELDKNNIKKNKRIKTYKELIKIKENILKEIPNLEWLEITRQGTKYIIDVTPKLIKEEQKEKINTDIIATKDGVIKHIVVHNGEKLKEENEYVKKGEVIISGEIYKDEELVLSGQAKGEVYAEVWYKAKIIVPLKYTEKVKSKEINHYYIELLNKQITITGYYKKDDLEKETKLILDKPYLPFKLYKEKLIEYKEKEATITEQEALKKALKLSENEIKKNLDIEEYIISKNVLKKELKSSKMYIEVFLKVYENIGTTSIREEKEKANEERNS